MPNDNKGSSGDEPVAADLIREAVSDEFIYKQNPKYVKMSPTLEPGFFTEILPTFQPWVLLVSAQIVFIYTGNMMIVPWLAYTGRPIYDYFLLDEITIDKKNEKKYVGYWPYKICLYFYVLTQAATWVFYLMLFSTNYQPDHWVFKSKPDTPLEFICFIAPAGFLAAMACMAGHELVHCKEGVHKLFGSIPFTLMFYSHFFDEHVKGHHKHVCTPGDPQFSQHGKNVYLGATLAYLKSHLTTWKRECERITRKNPNVSFLGILTQNLLVHHLILRALMIYSIYKIFGTGGLKFQLAYAAVKAWLAEASNFSSGHYGLERRKDAQGIYESVSARHSWNAVSSPIFFRIQRHSDHHAQAYRPYQLLRKLDLAPQLPYCYVGTLVLALCPPAFFHVMGPRVQAINDAEDGIPNDDQWNDTQPMSPADKKRDFVAQIWFFCVQVMFSAATFRHFEFQYGLLFTIIGCYVNLGQFWKYLIHGTA